MTDRLWYIGKFASSKVHPELLVMTIRWNAAEIIIRPDKTKPLVLSALLLAISEATRKKDRSTLENLVEYQLVPIILHLGWERFDDLSPPASFSNLEAFLIPPQYEFILSEINGVTHLLKKDSDDDVKLLPWSHPLQISGDLEVPRIKAKDIDIIAVVEDTKFVAQVRVNDEIMIAKWTDMDMSEIGRQLYGGLDIAEKAAKQSKSLNIPRISGVIEIEHDGRDIVVGILQEFVIGDMKEAENFTKNRSITLWDGKAVGGLRVERKKKWFAQVKETVHWLHQNGQIWGNNDVVIHGETDEAWLMGCGCPKLSKKAMKKAKQADQARLQNLGCFLDVAKCG